jgi:membrane protease YdiL (CAAX protease family)
MPLSLTSSDAIILLLMLAACGATWVIVAVRWRHGQPVLPYQPRRRVPWRLGDVALLMFVYFIGPALLVQASQSWLHVQVPAPPSPADEKRQINLEHPLERVLQQRPGVSVSEVVMCVLLAVVIAPIAEELLFRLVLQGWLESLERRLRRRAGWWRRLAAGVVPVGLTSLAFAALHIRGAAQLESVSTTVFLLSIQAAAGLLTLAVAVCWLKFAVGATAADFGIVPSKLASDVRLGLLAFPAIIVPVYAINIVLLAARELLQMNVVIDPLPLLLLAVVLGTLYYRTHRILPCIVLHMAFNAVAVIGAFLTPPG